MEIFDIQKVQVFLLSIILKVIYSLNRKSVKGRKNYVNNIQAGRPVIIAVWHGHLLSIVHDLRNEKVRSFFSTTINLITKLEALIGNMKLILRSDWAMFALIPRMN